MMAIVESPAPATVPGSPTRSVGEHVADYFRRIRGGDLGSLPAVAGLVVLCIVFTALRPVFFSAINFANLFTQGAQVVVIAMGLVFVLLLGEIDLSAGTASGVCASIMALHFLQNGNLLGGMHTNTFWLFVGFLVLALLLA